LAFLRFASGERFQPICHVVLVEETQDSPGEFHSILEEIVMKMDSKSGATLAIAAATLFLAGTAVSTTSTVAHAAAGKCVAANACKGQSACKSTTNSCKGQNACKGQGFTMSSKASCDATGGKFVAG
jgi:hypothetical protein